MATENRFRMLRYSNPEQAQLLTRQAQQDVQQRWELYQHLAQPGSSAP
jgi:pyruvate-ferredoxin/flavodoxin oxidoreductase